MKAHIYTPKATPGIELGAGALFLGEPTEENKICDVSEGAEVHTRQDKAKAIKDGIYMKLTPLKIIDNKVMRGTLHDI